MFYRLLVIFFIFGTTRLFSTELTSLPVQLDAVVYVEDVTLLQETSESLRPHPILEVFRKKQGKRRKLTAALIAFPFPFGIVGLHRIYLGCAPYVPVVYIASLGGVFGIVPLIDCIVLLASKDIGKYEDSDKVFIWIDN